MNTVRATLAWIVLGCLIVAFTGCASSQARVNNIQVASQRLQGTWLLQSYRPFTVLDPPLTAIINLQFGQLRVVINGAQMTAQGPGVQVVRMLQVLEADEDTATLLVSEPTGAAVHVRIAIEGNMLTFHPLDAPWGGEGTLRRL